jgi:DNA-directed RNA polymerase II subunit RPB4
MTEDDAGTQLHLGEFTNVPTLSISEARILVEAIHARRHMAGKRWTSTEVTHRMLGYMDTFARYNTEDQLKAVDNSTKPFEQLTMFEKSQLSK